MNRIIIIYLMYYYLDKNTVVVAIIKNYNLN